MSYIFVMIVLLIHVYILYIEMFRTNNIETSKAFDIDHEFLKKKEASIMMKNQGLYNGFLATGLFYTLFFEKFSKKEYLILFLVFVITAAIYQSITLNKKIIFAQGVPAIIALILVLIGW